MARLTDERILAICTAEVNAASGWQSGELSEQRADAMDRYLGEPLGDEVEGRSQVRTREVLDTVEWIMPSLMRIFSEQQNLVTFDPVGPEDEEQAEQESDRVAYAFWKQNRGFYNLYTFCKDMLTSKTGILKSWWDDSRKEEREEYQGLNDLELGELLHDPQAEREVMEYELTPDGHHVVFKTIFDKGRPVIDPCPPEEFGVSRDARSPYAKDAGFVYHRTRKTRSELIQMGYSRSLVDKLPDNDNIDTEERLSRRHLTDEQNILATETHASMRKIWITECYTRLDRDDDGIAELLKVTVAMGSTNSSAGAKLIDIEEVDTIPFYTAAPVILTHKFYGLSVADLVTDIQEIKTALFRGILDNMYLANNSRTAVNEKVNLDDLLTSRPGAVVRTRGETPPGENLMTLTHAPVPTETFGLLELLDEMRKHRTGVGDEVGALETNSLANINTGVAAMAYDAARSKIELVARIIAEIGLRPLFLDLHEMLQKNQKKAQVMKLRGQWIEVNPAEWRTREDMTVMVGMGSTSNERRMVGLEMLLEKQALVMQNGGNGILVTPEHIYKALHDWTDTLGIEPQSYWQNPAEAEPPPPAPDYQGMLLQIQADDVKAKHDKNVIDFQKAQAEAVLKAREMEIREREADAKERVEGIKAEVTALEAQLEFGDKSNKASLESQIQAREQERKEAETALKHVQESQRREVEVYKALLASGTALTQEQMRLAVGNSEDGESGPTGYFDGLMRQLSEQMTVQFADMDKRYSQALGERDAQIVEQRETIAKLRGPRVIKRDKSGRAVMVGDQPVVRGPDGLIQRIG